MPHIIPRILAMHSPISKMRVVGSTSCCVMDTFLSLQYRVSIVYYKDFRSVKDTQQDILLLVLSVIDTQNMVQL